MMKLLRREASYLLDLNILLCPYKFNLKATVDHHRHSTNGGHYTASMNCCGKPIRCNDTRITEWNINDNRNSSAAYILLYKSIV